MRLHAKVGDIIDVGGQRVELVAVYGRSATIDLRTSSPSSPSGVSALNPSPLGRLIDTYDYPPVVTGPAGLADPGDTWPEQWDDDEEARPTWPSPFFWLVASGVCWLIAGLAAFGCADGWVNTWTK